jgi:hypothetical protein
MASWVPVMQSICCQAAACVVACAIVVGHPVARAAAEDLMPVYGAVVRGPSVVLSYKNGASPYSGIGRYEGLERCTAFFVDTAASFLAVSETMPVEAPAYALTEGRCATRLDADDIAIDREGHGRVVFNYFADAQHRQVAVPVVRLAYGTVSGRNLALLELGVSYQGLVEQVIRPWSVAWSPRAAVGDPIAVVGAPLTIDGKEDFLRLAFCRIDGVAPVVVEHGWQWFEAPFNQCRDMRTGTSGSPVLSVLARTVVGLISTTTAGAERGTECALGHPCERTDAGSRSRKNTAYISPVSGIVACFDRSGRFRRDEPGCPLAEMPVRPRPLS